MASIKKTIAKIIANNHRAELREEKNTIKMFKKRVVSTLKNDEARESAMCWDDPNALYFEFTPVEGKWALSIFKYLEKKGVKYEPHSTPKEWGVYIILK